MRPRPWRFENPATSPGDYGLVYQKGPHIMAQNSDYPAVPLKTARPENPTDPYRKPPGLAPADQAASSPADRGTGEAERDARAASYRSGGGSR